MQTNLSINEQLSQYKNLMNCLIYEKPKVTQEKIEQKKAKIIRLAKEFIDIQGDEKFILKVFGYIENISSVKPGRKLIKALIKCHTQIQVEEGNEFNCWNPLVGNEKAALVIGPEKEIIYKSINEFTQEYYSMPLWIAFAHELIHILHHNIDAREHKRCHKVTDDILPDMDNLGEQYAITGFNHRLYKKKTLSPIDILCENAFHLALNLPPRINHRCYICSEIVKAVQVKNPCDPYYKWLEKELNLIRDLPEGMVEEEFILKYIKQYPLAIESLPHRLSEKLKNDENFMLKIIDIDSSTLKYFSYLCNNKNFMLQVVEKNDFAVLYISEELYKDSEFTSKCGLLIKEDLSKSVFEDMLNRYSKSA